MSKKRLIAWLMMGAMVVSSLAGCGGSKDDNKEDAKSNTSEETGTDAETETDENGKVDGIMYETGLPLVDEGDYTFSMFYDESIDSAEYYMADFFEKQTGVKVDFKPYPYDIARERLNLDMNSGDYADAIGGWILGDEDILNFGMERGIFIPLEDYFEKYCPKITEILDQPGVRDAMTAPDGHIYCIPYVSRDVEVEYCPYINTDWLERVNMELPTTTDEFEAVLKAFKEQDANGNGDPNDEIPFSADPNNKKIEALAGWFGVPMNRVGETVAEDGEVQYAGISSQYREFLSWFRKLYEQGLVDQELFTQDLSTWQGKGNRDLYGVSMAYNSGAFSGLPDTEEKPPYATVPVLNGDNGGKWLRYSDGIGIYRTQLAITDKAEHPEIICRWFDNLFQPDNAVQRSWGPLGELVEKDGDNYKVVVDKSTLPEEEQKKYEHMFPWTIPSYSVDYTVDEGVQRYSEQDVAAEEYGPYMTPVRPKFWVDLESGADYADISVPITEHFTTQQAQFIFGELDVDDDAVWNDYVSGMKDMGLERWCEYRGVTTILE